MGKGRTYELTMLRRIIACTDPRWVHAATLDYSGNASDSFADLEVSYSMGYDGHAHHMIELKKRSGEEGKRKTVMQGGTPEESGLDELRRLIDGCTNWQDPWVHIKFDNREPIVLHAEDLHYYLTGDTWRSYGDYCWDDRWKGDGPPVWLDQLAPRLTPSDNISMVKPELAFWPSTQAGEPDHIKLLRCLRGWEDHRFYDGDENARILNERE